MNEPQPIPQITAEDMAAMLLAGEQFGTNTALLRRLREIVPAAEFEEFKTTEAFRQSVLAAHTGHPWMLRRVTDGWEVIVYPHPQVKQIADSQPYLPRSKRPA
jgi:glucose/arabinose dehydrogenase